MCLTVKKLCCISLPILVFFLVLNFYLPTGAQGIESNTEKVETATSIENKSIPNPHLSFQQKRYLNSLQRLTWPVKKLDNKSIISLNKHLHALGAG